MRHALLSFVLVIGFSPHGAGAAEIGPKMNGCAKKFVAGMTTLHNPRLAGQFGNRRSSGDTLHLHGGSIAPTGTLAEHAWSEFVAEAWERRDNFMVGMLCEQLPNAATVHIQLLIESEQLLGDGNGQDALGRGDRRGSAEALGRGKDLQAFAVRLGPVQTVAFEELLPFFLAGTNQCFGGTELNNELPRSGQSPVIEGLACRRIVLVDRLLKLINQSGSLFNESDLIATEQSQFLSQWVLGLKRSPRVAVQPECVGKAPGIEAIVFHAGWGLAFTISLGCHGLDGIDRDPDLQQAIHERPAPGLDGHGEWEIGGDSILKLAPAFSGVFEFELLDNESVLGDDDNVMLVLRPIKAGEVTEGGVGRGG